VNSSSFTQSSVRTKLKHAATTAIAVTSADPCVLDVNPIDAVEPVSSFEGCYQLIGSDPQGLIQVGLVGAFTRLREFVMAHPRR
jgi:hypothetical protein